MFSDTDSNWHSRRKAMTPSFYKDRLRGLVNIAAKTVKLSIKRLNVEKERTIDIMHEILKMSIEIIFTCMLGENISN